jgi:hypothetical protein
VQKKLDLGPTKIKFEHSGTKTEEAAHSVNDRCGATRDVRFGPITDIAIDQIQMCEIRYSLKVQALGLNKLVLP